MCCAGEEHLLAVIAGRLLAAAAAGAGDKEVDKLRLGASAGAVSTGAALLSAGG
jgi:hypothetical protein